MRKAQTVILDERESECDFIPTDEAGNRQCIQACWELMDDNRQCIQVCWELTDDNRQCIQACWELTDDNRQCIQACWELTDDNRQCIQVCWELTDDNRQREIDGFVSALKRFGLRQGTIVHTRNPTPPFPTDLKSPSFQRTNT